MGLLDAIVPPDIASDGGYRLPRITVRPKGLEPPPAPENVAPTFADASDGTDNAPPARAGLFDDIVPPGPRTVPRTAADASNGRENARLARAGLFDDIVPPVDAAASAPPRQNSTLERMVPLSRQAASSIAAPIEGDIPYYDLMTGMQMPAPQLPPQSPGLPVRPETRAPLNTPPSGWPDLPVTAPRFGMPLAVPDPNVRGEGFPAPPGPTAMDRIKAAAARGFGEEPLGFSQENRAKYPHTYLTWQPFAAPLDFIRRTPGAAIGAVSSAGSELYKGLGGTETDANRLERDLNILGQAAMVEGGMVGRYYVAKPTANPFRATEGALSDEAAAARGTIAPTVPRAPPRQIFEASEQGMPIPRTGPQPPDKPAAQSGRMNSGAGGSGPFDSGARPAENAPPVIAPPRESAPLFKNRAPLDEIVPPKLFPAERIRMFGYNGKLDYVVTKSGGLVLGRNGHINLSGGADVLAAGEVQFVGGRVRYIDNASGHYRPGGNAARSAAEAAFNRAGFDATGKYIEGAF